MWKYWRPMCLACVLVLGIVQQGKSQDRVVEIRPKRTLFIPKLDLFWAGTVIAEGFPTFFPLEAELNIPVTRLSLVGVVSPWAESYLESETTRIEESSIIGGLGIRFYAFATQGVPGQGFFIEPQAFFRRQKHIETFKANSNAVPVTTDTLIVDRAFMGAVGYQHHFGSRFYAQARVSVGYTNTAILSGFRSGNLMVLPWLGIGIGF